MKISYKTWLVPTLATIAAILGIIFGSCSSRPETQQAMDESQDNVVASVEAGDAESAIDNAGAVYVQEYKPSMTLDLKNPPAPVVLDFNAVWCGPCQQFKPVFEQVAKKLNTEAVFYSVNVDSCPDLADRYGVEAIPTVIVVRTDGSVDRNTGLMTASDLEKLIKK